MGLGLLVAGFLIATAIVCVVANRVLYVERTGVAVLALCGVVATALIGVSVWGVSYRDMHWETCHVTGKDRGGQDGSYRIYTRDCDTLANEDSMFQGKYNSSNVWQQIKPGQTYRFRIVGSRLPFFSQFKNVMEVQPVKG